MKLTQEYLESRIDNVHFLRDGPTLTVCIITMKNGFQLTATSACVDPENFDKELGEKIAYNNAFAKLWELEGYVAKERSLAEHSDGDLIDAFKALQRKLHKTATDAGWYHNPETGEPVERNFGEVTALMHSELSEALEADRKSLMDSKLPHRNGVEVEFADCIIRILDTAEARGYDIAGAIIEKNEYNRKRSDHKLENRAAANGKRY